jgi:hypothetical protein
MGQNAHQNLSLTLASDITKVQEYEKLGIFL